jgi:formate dehydrogenase alpha subunit
MTNSIAELEDTDCVFIIGSNTTENHPVIGTYIKRAKQKGAKIIVADPRVIELAEKADIYMQLTPGTNVALLNGMMNVIIEEKLQDEEFIRERCENYEQLLEVANSYSPERVEEITGVKADTIREAARLYAVSPRSSIVYAMGITQHSTGTENVFSIANLAMLCGKLGKEGCGVNPLRGQNNVQGACDMGALPDVFPAYQKVHIKDNVEKFERAWGVKLSDKPGITVPEMMNDAHDGNVKAIYIMGENPMVSDPDTNHVRAALEHLDFLVVQDIFMTETAKLANVVLPGTSFMEKDGTFTNTERRVQRVRKAIEPIGGSRPDWVIMCDLMKAFGCKVKYKNPEEIMEEIRILVPSYGGITYERLEDQGIQWPCPDINHPGTKLLHKGKFSRGLGKFTVNEYEASKQQPSDEYPYILTTGRIQHHYHTGTMTRRSWALNREYPEAYMEINPQDAEKLGLREGSKAKVSSKIGDILIKVKITDKISSGVVFIPFHFSEAAVNKLIGEQHDPVVQIPEYKLCAVKLEGVK